MTIIKLKRRNVVSGVLYLMRNAPRGWRWWHVKVRLRFSWERFVEEWRWPR